MPPVHSVAVSGADESDSEGCKLVKLIKCPRGTLFALLLGMREKRNSMTFTKAIPYETLDEVAAQMRADKEDMSVIVGEWAEEPTKNCRRPR